MNSISKTTNIEAVIEHRIPQVFHYNLSVSIIAGVTFMSEMFLFFHDFVFLVDQDIINQNPTPHEIKERLANLKLNGSKKTASVSSNNNDNSDQENQKPTNGAGRKVFSQK